LDLFSAQLEEEDLEEVPRRARELRLHKPAHHSACRIWTRRIWRRGDPGTDVVQQQVISKGWGYAILSPASIQADNGAGLTSGIIGLCNKGQLRRRMIGELCARWAWGASRALDYFETDKAVDARQVGIEGLSRYGRRRW